MKRQWLTALVLLAVLAILPAAEAQQQRVIVRDQFGPIHLGLVCPILGCSVVLHLGDPAKQLFLVTPKQGIGLDSLVGALLHQLGILNVEVDQTIVLLSPALAGIPDGLYDVF